MRYRLLLLSSFCLALGACASKPTLYPNNKYKSVGKAKAEKDVKICMNKADEYVENEKAKNVAKGAGAGAAVGAVVGAIFGGTRGAMRGAAGGAAGGAVGGALSPERIKQNFVNRCLAEDGYEVIGWD